jgi:hypothetical protein
MKNSLKWLILVVGVAGVAAIVYNKWPTTQPVVQTQPVAPVELSPAPATQAEPPPIRYPVGEAGTAETKPLPLPALAESDSAAQGSVLGLVGQKPFADFFQSSDIIRRIVATVDNLPREKVALRLMPVKSVAGRFATTSEGGSLVISPDNASRYTPYVRLMEAVDAKKLGATYAQFYPLFQQAYKELGYPKGYFNDRLVEVIDHLLAAPDIKGPIKLVRPKVMYEFADPQLEALSAGQKIMIRMGSVNAAKVKAKLTEIRGEFTSQATKQ